MNRSTTALIAVVPIAVLMAGCSSSSSNDAPTQPAQVSSLGSSASIVIPSFADSAAQSAAPSIPESSAPDVPSSGDPYLAVCQVSDGGGAGFLKYFDVTGGAELESVPVQFPDGSSFSAAWFDSIGGSCDASFDGGMTKIAGVDKTNGLPATWDLSSGQVQDMASAPTPPGGFNAPKTETKFVGSAFNPVSEEYWYASYTYNPDNDWKGKIRLYGPGTTRTYSYDEQEAATYVDFFFPLGQHSVPTLGVEDHYNLPSGKVVYDLDSVPEPKARQLYVSKDDYPETNYTFDKARISDDGSHAAFLALNESGAASLWTSKAAGGEPRELVSDVPGIEQDVSQMSGPDSLPLVVRFKT